MNFDIDIFNNIYMTAFTAGTLTGFTSGFISWAFGFAIYSIIKLFKHA